MPFSSNVYLVYIYLVHVYTGVPGPVTLLVWSYWDRYTGTPRVYIPVYSGVSGYKRLLFWSCSGRYPGIPQEYIQVCFTVGCPATKYGCFCHTCVGTRVSPEYIYQHTLGYAGTKHGCFGHTRIGIRVSPGVVGTPVFLGYGYHMLLGTRIRNVVVLVILWHIPGYIPGYPQRKHIKPYVS